MSFKFHMGSGFIAFAVALTFVSFSGASGEAAAGSPNSSPNSDALSGRLTFDFVNWIRHDTEAIVDITLPKTEFRRSASGKFGWRHPDGDLIRTQGCGNYVNRLIVDRADGSSEIVSPCSSEIDTISASSPQFEFARLSPDGKRVAAELKFYVQEGWYYAVLILEAGEIVANFLGYAAPAWLPDGRLVLAGDGLYVTSVDGSPKRIDNGWIGIGVNNPDVSPDGKLLVFEYSERIWVMDVEGEEHKELVAGPMQYRFPAWSPEGTHVAFLATAGSDHSEVDRALHILDVRNGELERVDISSFGGPLNHVPFGPLSWTK